MFGKISIAMLFGVMSVLGCVQRTQSSAISSAETASGTFPDSSIQIFVQAAYSPDRYDLHFAYTKPDGSAGTLDKSFPGGDDRLPGDVWSFDIRPNTDVTVSYTLPASGVRLSSFVWLKSVYPCLPKSTWILDLSGSQRYTPLPSDQTECPH